VRWPVGLATTAAAAPGTGSSRAWLGGAGEGTRGDRRPAPPPPESVASVPMEAGGAADGGR